MRIVIDLQACQNASRDRGIGRYALAMTKAMIGLNRGHDYRIVLSDRFADSINWVRDALEGVLPQAHVAVCALPPRTATADPANAWRTRAAEILRARFIAGLAPDLLFVPSLFEGYWDNLVVSVEPAPFPTAVTMFDFIPLEEPELYLPTPSTRDAYMRRLRNARDADLLLAISGFVAGQAASRLDVPADRIITVPLGADSSFRPPRAGDPDRGEVMRRHGIARPFVLTASPFEHRKNLPGLIAAFGLLPAAVRDAHQLVLVGGMNAEARRAIATLAARAGLPADAVVLTGFVPDHELVALYGHCTLFAFLSLSEGFGLPLLEAMACGAPVVASSTTSLPEVVGRGDILCDPGDPTTIAATIARVLGNPALQTELRAYGTARAAGFTWERAAATALDAFERLPGRPTAPPAGAAPATAPRTLAIVAETADLLHAALPFLRSLADMFDSVFISPDGIAAPVLTVAVRDTGWFERHAPAFDHILYCAGADGDDRRLAALMEVFPGTLLLLQSGRESDLALRTYASGVVVMGGAHSGERALPSIDELTNPPDMERAAALLCRAIIETAAAAAPDPRRCFAASLPRSIDGVRPTNTDIAALAVAYERNMIRP